MDTVFSCLEVSAKKRGDFIAISSANSEITFSEWHETSLVMANKLKMIGLKKGDKIGLALDQSPEVACLIMGCIHTGVVFVPILPSGSFFNNFNITLFMINFSLMYAINKETNIFFKKN